MLSSIEMSMRLPRPVRPRSISAARMLLYAYMPAAMSAIEQPAFAGSSGVPVIERNPDSLWISRSYAFLSR